MTNVIPIGTRTRAQPSPILPVQGSRVSATNSQMRDLEAYAKALCEVRVTKDAGSRPFFYELANGIRRGLNRDLMPALKPARFMLAAFILDRTLEWGHLAKIITLDQFESGIRDEGGQLKTDGQGIPYSSGTGLAKRYVRQILGELTDLGHVERMPVLGTNTYLWFPASRRDITVALKQLGADPRDFPEVLTRGL